MKLRVLIRNRGWLLGCAILLLVVACSIAAPLLAPSPADAIGRATHPEERLLPPSREHLMGTDDLGRDVFSRVLFGARLSLRAGVMSAGIAGIFGVTIGLISGYCGGWVDTVLMRITDVFMAVPTLILAIAVATIFGPGLMNAMLAVAFTLWTVYARLARAECLSKREELFVMAARSFGAGDVHILLRHIVPNTMSPIIVQLSFHVGRAILAASALGFLGMGARPPAPEWGLMVSQGSNYMPEWWWSSVFPGTAIMVVVLAVSLIGDGLTDSLGRSVSV